MPTFVFFMIVIGRVSLHASYTSTRTQHTHTRTPAHTLLYTRIFASFMQARWPRCVFAPKRIQTPILNASPHNSLIYPRRFYASGASVKVSPLTSGRSGPLGRKNVITLRPAAVERLKELNKENTQLKIGLRKKGCSGNSFVIYYSNEPPHKYDEKVEQDGVTFYVDYNALLSMIGSEVDFVHDALSSQFVFYNPNVKETCGCGLSFTV